MDSNVVSVSRSSLLLRGLANVIFGAIVFSWPGMTVYLLVIIFAINIILIGAMELFKPFVDKNTNHSILTFLLGLLGMVVGFYLLGRPELTVGVLSLVIAFWAVLFGISDLFVGFTDSKTSGGYRFLFIIAGVLSLMFGGYLIFYPVVTIVSFVWILGLYAVITGAMYIVGSFFIPKSKSKK
ncbi:MAG: hypothetical protein QG675_472 [Patescibacteria group bacterium]|jgi:uncharacterized membrane protein HdeD (DUF308 family)|nr:hypothetical protein [Patescibacteria group bacterium]